MRDGEVAAGRRPIHGTADETPGIVRVRNDLQETEVEHGNRLVEVYEPLGLRVVEDAINIPNVFEQEGRALVGGEQGIDLLVPQNDGIIVDVHDPRTGVDALSDLVHVPVGRQPAPVVDELADTALTGKEADKALQIPPVVARLGERSG